jgi:hypothetical protein
VARLAAHGVDEQLGWHVQPLDGQVVAARAAQTRCVPGVDDLPALVGKNANRQSGVPSSSTCGSAPSITTAPTWENRACRTPELNAHRPATVKPPVPSGTAWPLLVNTHVDAAYGRPSMSSRATAGSSHAKNAVLAPIRVVQPASRRRS